MNNIDMSLMDFVRGEKSLERTIKDRLGITSVAELLMFPIKSLWDNGPLGWSIASDIKACAIMHNLTHRNDGENVLDYLNRAYGSLDQSRVAVLNFVVDGNGQSRYVPLEMVTRIITEHPSLTIADLKQPDGDTTWLSGEPASVDDLRLFAERLHSWGFQRRE